MSLSEHDTIDSTSFDSNIEDSTNPDDMINECLAQTEFQMKEWLNKDGTLLFKKLAIEHLMKLEKESLSSHISKNIPMVGLKRENAVSNLTESAGSKKKIRLCNSQVLKK